MAPTKLKKIFKKYPAIKLAYLFGSRATGDIGPMSDYDFGFYLDEKSPSKRLEIKLALLADLGNWLKTDAIDVVILNDTDNSELKYRIIHDGELLYSQKSYQLSVEPRILNEYFDFQYTLRKYHLTKA